MTLAQEEYLFMKPHKLLTVTLSAAAVLLWGSAWAQTPGQSTGTPERYPTTGVQNPATPADPTTTETPGSTYPSSSSAQKLDTKEKHWSGALVDVSCMAKELSAGNNASPQQPAATAPAGVPHFASEVGEPPLDSGQQRPGGGAMGPGEGNPNTTPTPNTATPGATDMSPADAAQMAKAARIDNAAKQCPPTSSTQTFGLSMSGGQVVQFDRDGDTKAAEALKEVSVQPGKKVRAKVTGTLANTTTVKVATIEIKGKRSSQGSSASASGSGL
jgi:hypothetical protein